MRPRSCLVSTCMSGKNAVVYYNQMVCFADPTCPFDSGSSSPSHPSSTADISPCNLRKALPVGYEEKERWIVLCSVLKGSQIVDSPLGEQDSHPELRVHRP